MLVGKWQKITTTPCSQNYPDQLEFSDRGLYTGRQTNPQENFTWWDVGTYEVTANQVKIAIATDEIKPYPFSLKDRLLTFVDADNCEFQYRRVE
jgi:hypothetical protein